MFGLVLVILLLVWLTGGGSFHHYRPLNRPPWRLDFGHTAIVGKANVAPLARLNDSALSENSAITRFAGIVVR